MHYIGDVYRYCTFETYIILLTNATPINLITIIKRSIYINKNENNKNSVLLKRNSYESSSICKHICLLKTFNTLLKLDFAILDETTLHTF